MSDIDLNDLFPKSKSLAKMNSKSLVKSTVQKLIDEFKPEDWLKPIEIGAMFGVDTRTVHRWSRKSEKWQAKVRSFRTLGGHRRYNRADVIELMENEAS